MWKTCAFLLALACVVALGIESVKGNVELFGRKSRLPDTFVRVEGRNCPFYYPNEKP